MWWLLLLLLIPAWWLVPAALGTAMSPSTTGRLYLRDLLKKAGVSQLVPDGCVRELVEHDIRVAAAMSKFGRVSLKTEMVKMLEGTATMAVVWITGEALPLKDDSFVPSTLLKYGIQRGALKRL